MQHMHTTAPFHNTVYFGIKPAGCGGVSCDFYADIFVYHVREQGRIRTKEMDIFSFLTICLYFFMLKSIFL